MILAGDAEKTVVLCRNSVNLELSSHRGYFCQITSSGEGKMRFGFLSALTLSIVSWSAFAAPIVSIPSFTHSVPSSGTTVTVSLPISGVLTPTNVVGFDAQFTITPQAGATGTLTPTGDWAAEPTNAVFGGVNPSQNAASPFLASYALPDPQVAALSNGQNLVKFTFVASANAEGQFAIAFTGGSALYDADTFANIATFQGGTITVEVPEPAVLSLLALAGAPLLARRRHAA